MTQAEIECVEAAEAACRDFVAGTGGCYSGPAIGIYLRIMAVLQTATVRAEYMREEESNA